jgi:hypothetical protein
LARSALSEKKMVPWGMVTIVTQIGRAIEWELMWQKIKQ